MVTHSLMTTCFMKNLFYITETQGKIIVFEIFCTCDYYNPDTGEIYILAYNLFLH
jgi:hypothetical protein